MSDAIDTDVADAAGEPVEPAPQGPVYALATVATLVPTVVFGPGGIDALLTALETDVRAQVKGIDDISIPKNRKAIASLAYKVARSKTALDDMGKDLGAEWKRRAGLVDADRRILRERLEALQAEVRAPLDRYEAEEETRIRGHEAALAEIEALTDTEGLTAEAINERIWAIPSPSDRAWQEFLVRAERTIEHVQDTLKAAHAAALAREAEEAEAAAARAAEAARIAAENEAARIENEKRIAANARAVALIEAENAAERERQAAALALAEAEAKTALALKAAEQAAAQAEADAAAAVEAERRRVAALEAAEAAETERRARSKAHRQRINTEALADMLQAVGADETKREETVAMLKLVIVAIATRNIRHVDISY